MYILYGSIVLWMFVRRIAVAWMLLFLHKGTMDGWMTGSFERAWFLAVFLVSRASRGGEKKMILQSTTVILGIYTNTKLQMLQQYDRYIQTILRRGVSSKVGSSEQT